MIQNRIGRKFRVAIWDVRMNQSALTKFFRILGISTVWLTISLSNLKFRVVQKDRVISRAFRDKLNQRLLFFEQHMNYFNTQ